MGVKWIKICTDIFDDDKLLLIESMPNADATIVIWFKLLCMAGKSNNNGVFMLNERIAYTDEMLATIFRRPVATIRLALQTFESFGMIERVENVITIPNWNKHQSLDQLEASREKTRKRVAKYREKQKAIAIGSNVTVALRNADRIEEEENREEEKRKEGEEEENNNKGAKAPARKRFVPPTLEEVQAYCFERQNQVDAERFIDYYTANGWRVGKNPMKDWKASVRTWEKTSNSTSSSSSAPKPSASNNVFLDLFNEEDL